MKEIAAKKWWSARGRRQQVEYARSIRAGRVIATCSRDSSARSRGAALSQVRQWARVRLQRDPALDHRGGHRDGTHRAGQALAERHRRELQRPLPRGVPQHGMVPHAKGGRGHHRDLAASLQRGPTALKSRLFDTDRVQRNTWQPTTRSERLLSSFDWSEEPRQVITTVTTASRTTNIVETVTTEISNSCWPIPHVGILIVVTSVERMGNLTVGSYEPS